MRMMMLLADGSEQESKIETFYEALTGQDICREPSVYDYINLRLFLRIIRDIFGVNTFEITDDDGSDEPCCPPQV